MIMQNDTLKVSLLTISPHNRAILEFFFAGAGKALFRLTSAHEAEAFIIDYDHPDAHAEWEKLHRNQTSPCIILSIRDVSLPNSIWVAKPLTSKALTEASQRIQALLQASNLYKPKSPVPPVSSPTPTPSTPTIEAAEIHTHSSAPLPSFGLPLSPKASVPPPIEPVKIGTPQPLLEESVVTLAPSGAPTKPINTSLTARSPKPLLVRDTVTSMAEPPSNEDPVKRQQRWSLLCGTLPDTTPENLWRDQRTFDANQYLLGALIQASQQAKETGQVLQVFVNRQHYILLMPQPYYAFSSLDIHGVEFANLCTHPMVANQVHIHTPSATEQVQLGVYTQQHPSHLYDLDACLWTVALLTSGGRLSPLYEPHQTYRLRHWPNLTRMESIPHVMSIAALWTQQVATPFDIAKQLGIPQRYVFAFHSATRYLQLLHCEQAAPKTHPTTEPKKNRGLFSRLLKRLLGGGAK